MPSYDEVLKVSIEALGSEPFKNIDKNLVIARAKELEGKVDQPFVEALREATGHNFYSQNVARQVTERLKNLSKPLPGTDQTEEDKSTSVGRLSADPNAPHLKESIVDGTDVAAANREFEKNPDAALRGSGGNTPSTSPTPFVNSFNPSARNK